MEGKCVAPGKVAFISLVVNVGQMFNEFERQVKDITNIKKF
jgi:hypothetical protein